MHLLKYTKAYKWGGALATSQPAIAGAMLLLLGFGVMYRIQFVYAAGYYT